MKETSGMSPGWESRCRSCGVAIPADSDTDDLCTTCVATHSLADEGAATESFAGVRGEEDGSLAWNSSETRGGRFRPVRAHARGGLGMVAVAVDQDFEREVALKEILPDRADLPHYQERFLFEARVTGCLEHPGIVPVYGLGLNPNGQPFYAMRFIRGNSLSREIKKFHAGQRSAPGPLARSVELRKLLQRFISVCQAVGYAHSRGVLHRDLKPSNVVVGKFGETMVVDWGMAKVLAAPHDESRDGERSLSRIGHHDETLDGSVAGTRGYMSPEQAQGRISELAPASDVYSLGATLYCLLTGASPLNAEDEGEFQRRVATGNFPTPREVNSKIPQPLDAICRKAMAIDPSERYPTAQELAADVEQWLADEPVAAYEEPLLAQAGRWVRRHRTLVTSVVASLLVAVIGLSIGMTLLTSAYNAEAEARELAQESDRATRQALAETQATIDKYVETIRNSDLLKEERFKALRTELLHDALEHYQRFLDQHAHDDHKLAELAGALGQIVEISTDNGTYEEAESASRRRIDIYQQLLTREPDSPEHWKFLAQSHAGLGNAYSQSERWEEAIAEHERAVEILRDLRAKSPRDALLARWLATNLYNIGLRQVDLNYLDKALAAFLEGCEVLESLGPESLEQVDNAFLLATLAGDASRRAGELGQQDLQQELGDRTRAIATELVEKVPDSARYQRLLANANYYAALGYKAERNLSQAIAAFRAAEAGYQQVVKVSPNTLDHLAMLLVVQEGLGLALFQDGKPDEALEWLHQAMQIGERVLAQPTTATHYHFQIGQVFSTYGVALRSRGRTEEAMAVHQRAIKLFRELLKEHPESAKVAQALAGNYLQLGRIHKEDQQNEEAIEAYREATSVYEAAVKANPRGFLIANNLARTYNNLGNAYVQNGQVDEAIATMQKAIPLLEQALALGPQELSEYRDLLAATHNNLSTAYAPRQQWNELKFHFEQALEIWEEVRPPAFVARVSNGYAWKLAVAPYDEYRDGAKALRYATRACELTQWKNGGYLDTLAAAYAATGDFDNAAKWQQKCIELAPVDDRGEFEERLKLYQEGKAYRQPLAEMEEAEEQGGS